jgi:hypothetical protein
MKLPPNIGTMLKEVFIALTFAILAASFAFAEGFTPFPFDKVGALDDHSKLEVITGGTLGVDVLEHWESAVLVFIGKRTVASNGVHQYSFNFDGRPATKFAQLTKNERGDLYEALTEPSNYGSAEHEFPINGRDPEENLAQERKYDEAWAQDLALEIVSGKTFVRVYLDKAFTRCYFVSCAGERSHDWIVSAELTKVLRRIAKSELKWIAIPNGLVNQQAEQADQPATKPADKPPVKGHPSTPTSKDGTR